jgi:hypothetical protein
LTRYYYDKGTFYESYISGEEHNGTADLVANSQEKKAADILFVFLFVRQTSSGMSGEVIRIFKWHNLSESAQRAGK